MTKDIILKKVKAFPPLDDTVSKVMAICNDENGSIGELAKVVQSDPMTMANILKAANSPLYGFSREINSISQAVSIFGMDTVKGFAFSSFLQKKLDLNLEPYSMDAKSFAEITEKQSVFVTKWFKGDKNKLDVLILTSFLMEIGKIVLANVVVENRRTKEFKAAMEQTTNAKELRALEESVFNITNEEITAIVFKEWNFDEKMCEAIEFLHHPEDASNNAQEYSQILEVIKTFITTQPYDQEEQLQKALELVEKYGLNREKFLEVVENQLSLETSAA